MRRRTPPRPIGRRRNVLLAAVVLWLLAPFFLPPAWAQYEARYLPEIYSYQGGRKKTGLRFGRLHLHTVLGTRLTYDTNAVYSAANEEDDFIFELVPGLDLKYEKRRINLHSGYRFTWRENFSESIQDSLEHRANLKSKFRASRRFSIEVDDEFTKDSDPADIDLMERVDRLTNEASAKFAYNTPAEDLDLSLQYANVYQAYDAALDASSFFNNKVSITSRINVASHFRFLPKSVLSADVEYGRTDFNAPSVPSVYVNNDSQGIAFTMGLSSQFSRKLSLAAKAGVSALWFVAGPDALGVTGSFTANYRPSRRLSVGGGYQRDYQVSTFTNYYDAHRFFLDAKWRFARRFELKIRNAYDFLDFSGPNGTGAGAERDDFLIRLITRLSYSIIEWCKAWVEYAMDYRDSNATDPILGTQSADFLRHSISMGFDFYY